VNKWRNPYRPVRTQVLESVVETSRIKTLRLRPEEPIVFEAGQFVELTLPGFGEAPFTPSSRPSLHDELFLTVMKVGKVTEAVHRLEKGDTVGLRGPLGTGYPIESFKGREVLVVGGGCGFAPLRSLMYALMERSAEFKKLVFRGGCRTPADMVYRKELAGWAQREDLDIELTERMSLITAVHYERNNWTSEIVGDERRGAHENVVQGEVILVRQLTDHLRAFAGFQRSNRKQSFESDGIKNTNFFLGIEGVF
jgi:NAD(P)H-flavin reductase